MSEIAVFGAGFVGVSTAIELRRAGCDVILIDKVGPGGGASFGNAGIIQSEAVEPYAMPRDPLLLLRVAFGRDTSVALRYPGVFRLAGPLLSYFRHSSANGIARATKTNADLIKAAQQAHYDLADLAGARDQFKPSGYRLRFDTQKALDDVEAEFSRMARGHGLALKVLSADALAEEEPGLNNAGAGGLEWPDPMSVERPDLLLQRYFEYFQSIGGVFAKGDAQSLSRQETSWTFVTDDGTHTAEQVVIATGAATLGLAPYLGSKAPIIPKRGYHAVLSGGQGLNAPLVDAEQGFVFVPQGNKIRVTTGAEIGGKEPLAQARQLKAGIARAHALLQTEMAPISTWSGVRPCLPDMLPVIGASAHTPGLWFNFGQGHQGLTTGPMSGKLLAQTMTGTTPASIPAPFSPARFGL